MLRLLCLLAVGLMLHSTATLAQPVLLKSVDRTRLRNQEDTLLKLSFQLNTDSAKVDRMRADSHFTRVLVRTLQTPHSFWYAFDSLRGISKLYAPDSSFRIFTWNLSYDEYYHRQKGAIQMRTKDGSLKIFPLRDVSEFTENVLDSVRDRMNWIGAVYYNLIQTEHNGKSFYTLFGFDPNGVRSSKKWMEVLQFDNRGEPVFGGPFFRFENDSLQRQARYRYQIEFKKDARILMNFIPDLKMILVDHLISEDNEPENKWTYIPDGDQEGFVWKNGKWQHIEKVFNQKLKDGEAPREVPILDQRSNQKFGNQ